MGGAIGGMLGSAVGIAISPFPIIVMVLLLSTPRAKANGIAFALAWVATLTVVSAALVAGGGASTGGEPARWTYWMKLGFGLLFLAIAVKQWSARPRPGHTAKPPKFLATIDTFGAGKSAGLAVLLSAVSPKNLALIIAGAVAIASSPSSSGGKTVALILFVVIGSLCTLVPLAVFLLGGTKAAGVLDGWKTWMGAHNAAIVVVLCLVLGSKFIGEALTGL
ncbi:GAP family protein [Streptacidiphilus sp. P02-A3a]|uniref:GAP family protein n=1 Tax=Streptacidiphilus sp. P02-A3a TaxID=2704468 RepID=UPI0015FB9023|nr:GAP family protein [Streptacidiphilus sp. P02-A3a]QMU69113.1 GAP family protein [Streptacidiphilus sp. P02-A3a]